MNLYILKIELQISFIFSLNESKIEFNLNIFPLKG